MDTWCRALLKPSAAMGRDKQVLDGWLNALKCRESMPRPGRIG